MSPFQEETTELISILDDAIAKIDKINNPDIHWLKTKIQMDLKRHSTALKMQLGQEFEAMAKPQRQPLKKLFGKEVVVNKVVTDVNKPGNERSFEVEEKELKVKVDELYEKFLLADAEAIISSINELEIRGVANKAGLPVTETHPKTITTGFIDQIKEAIRKQLAPGKSDENSENINGDPDETGSGEDGNSGKGPLTEEIAVNELRQAVDKLYIDFPSLENKEITDTYGDIEIRGVAKKAGLPVTETQPAKIDAKFLNQIKAAIKKQAEINKLGE